MTPHQHAKTNRTNTIRGLIAGAIMAAAPLMIAIGTATQAHADTTVVNTPDPGFHAPVRHPAFPNQSEQSGPGTLTHHHHQHHRGA